MSTPGFTPESADGRAMTQARSDALHFAKNKPPVPEIDGTPLSFPAYQYQAYPCAMYHATDPMSPRIAKDATEAGNLESRGWHRQPVGADDSGARAAELAANAAVRAFDDRRLSAGAQTELAEAEAAAGDHVLDVPRRGPGRPRKEEA